MIYHVVECSWQYYSMECLDLQTSNSLLVCQIIVKAKKLNY